MLHNLPPKHPQTSLFFPTAPRHHRTVGPQTHKCCNYLSLSSILFSPSSFYPLASSLLFPPSPPSLFPGNQPSLEASAENSSSPRSAPANHSGLSEARLSALEISLHFLTTLPRSTSPSCSLLKSWAHLCCFYSQLRPLQTPMSVFSWAVYFPPGQPLLKSPLSKLLWASFFLLRPWTPLRFLLTRVLNEPCTSTN